MPHEQAPAPLATAGGPTPKGGLAPTALCACRNLADAHAEISSGDTRCLVVALRDELLTAFDDGRAGDIAE